MHSSEKRLIEYLVLFFGLGLLSFLFLFFRYSQIVQIVVVSAVSVFYALWGIVHHALEGRLNRAVILEYSLISLFVFLLLLTAIKY